MGEASVDEQVVAVGGGLVDQDVGHGQGRGGALAGAEDARVQVEAATLLQDITGVGP